jgi:hypothetical protein
MIREKGGRRQPRYFRLKDQASDRLVSFLENRTGGPKAETRVVEGLKEGLTEKMARLSGAVDDLLFSIQICIWAGV